MAHSSLLNTERAPTIPAGRDTGSLGPSDSSDSGSDIAGSVGAEDGDPGLPADVAMEGDRMRTPASPYALDADTDMAGTGERRSAGGDAGLRDAGDILPDRIVDPAHGADEAADDVDALLAAGVQSGEHEDDNDEEDDEDHETPRKEEHPSGPRRRR